MGQKAIYKCNNCGNKFESHEGGGFEFMEYRCVKCDTIVSIDRYTGLRIEYKNNNTSLEKIGVCKKCGGELKDNLKPMCPKCKSRDNSEEHTFILYD